MKKLKLILTFYKVWLIAAWIITGSCMMIIYTNGINTFTALFWFKIITLLITYYLVNEYKRHELYYYYNLGVSKIFLWISTFFIDFSLFLFSLIFIYNIR